MNELHITKGSGKMEGIFSINTPTSTNDFCQKMANGNTICASCYAMRYEAFRPALINAFNKNVKLLLSKSFQPHKVPYNIMRLHSFGELHNARHFANFVKMAFVNPNTTFALWSKRVNIIQSYLRRGGVVPSNLILIYSNPKVDEGKQAVPKGFNKVFNVFTGKYAKKHNLKINCGAKDCKSCMLCYTHNDTEIINEKKK